MDFSKELTERITGSGIKLGHIQTVAEVSQYKLTSWMRGSLIPARYEQLGIMAVLDGITGKQ